jgi:hypothetical protein
VTVPAAAASLVCTGLCVACLLYLHLSPTGYSPLRNAVSEYGVGAYGRWYQAQAALAGLAAALLAAALHRHGEIAALLLVFTLARIAITQYPTDLIHTGTRTRAGAVHLLLAAIAFAAICWAACALARRDGGEPALGWIASAGAVGTWLGLRSPMLRPVLGLLERVFYAAFLAWLALVAVRLL